MPKFSIVIPCFNATQTVIETLDSIRAQSCEDWELICVDDGSTDLTRDIIADAAKQDRRIRLAFNPGSGPSAARNFGAMHAATGEIIAFCDADDIWDAEKLATLDVFFSETGHDATFGKIAFFANDTAEARVFSTVPSQPLTIDDLLGENPVCTMSNLSIRKKSMLRFGGFDTEVVHNEDIEWLIRIVGQGGSILGQQSLQVWYRTSPAGLSSNLEAMEAGRASAIRTAARYGVRASRRSNAIHKRYLARRALRMGEGRLVAVKLAGAGFVQSPKGFLSPPSRGLLVLLAVFLNLVLPRAVSRALFS